MNEGSVKDATQKYFALGDLIWTKIGKHPFWPSMVTYDPFDGTFMKLLRTKLSNQPIYHVQYFGKSVQHGWTTPGNSLKFEGEKAYLQKAVDLLIKKYTFGKKSHLKLKAKYAIPAASRKKWYLAVIEAEEALQISDPKKRFEKFIFNFDKVKLKNPASNGTVSGSNGSHHTFDENAHSSKRIRLSDDSSHVCDVCNKNNAPIPCIGFCNRYFHVGCIGITAEPETFRCARCFSSLFSCYACKKSGGDLKICSYSKCRKYYHADCLGQYECSDKAKYLCPLHACLTCYRENALNMFRKGNIVQCVHCPAAFHSSVSCIPAGSVERDNSIICPYHLVGKLKTSHKKTSNFNFCAVCNAGGELVCCEACPNAFHKNCHHQLKFVVPSEDFICDDCVNRRYLLYNMVVWGKTGKFRWWPGLIVHPSELTDKLKNLKHSDGEFPVKFFGTHDYSWLHSGRAFPYTEEDKTRKAPKKDRLEMKYKLGLEEAAKAFDAYQNYRNKEPAFYKHIQVNRALAPAEIHTKSKNISVCSCDPSKENPCGPESECVNRSMLMECQPDHCVAKDLCQNQKFQKREYVKTKVFKTANCGWGLKTLEDVKKGTFIIEYVGEVITHLEYLRRSERMQMNGNSKYYFLYLDAKRMIDAGPMGNNSRFINHSCNPNCEMRKWSVHNDSRIGIFAIVDIPAETELTFNYQLDRYKFEQKCFCKSENCSGVIGKKIHKSFKSTGKTSKTLFSKTVSSKVSVSRHKVRSNKRSKNSLASEKCFESSCPSTSSSSTTNRYIPKTSTSPPGITSVYSAPEKEHLSRLPDVCGICKENNGERRVMCDEEGCERTYHLECCNLTKVPLVSEKEKPLSCTTHRYNNTYRSDTKFKRIGQPAIQIQNMKRKKKN